MSLRPTIYAMPSVAELRDWLAAGPDDRAEQMMSRYCGDDRSADSEARAWLAPAVNQVVRGEVDVEDEAHATAMHAAARILFEERWKLVCDGDWKHVAWTDLQDITGDVLRPRDAELLSYLVNGRPFVGARVQSSWSYTAWLLLSEVQELRTAGESLRRDHPEVNEQMDGFLDQIVSWLSQIEQRQSDAWLFAC